NQSKNNRYQQTWHTIEFSNNRSLIQSSTTTNHNGQQIAPEQLFKLTRTSHTKQTSPEPPPAPTAHQSTTGNRPFEREKVTVKPASAAATRITLHTPNPRNKFKSREARHTRKSLEL
ncbi:hypothetical protein, partial [Paenarthrobacter ureafaciens]|uniref:hypothetical protein n=1 Tax=Paenarthrobacter ureafaciens TaxID=37931 RepID=UPI002DB66C30